MTVEDAAAAAAGRVLEGVGEAEAAEAAEAAAGAREGELEKEIGGVRVGLAVAERVVVEVGVLAVLGVELLLLPPPLPPPELPPPG